VGLPSKAWFAVGGSIAVAAVCTLGAEYLLTAGHRNASAINVTEGALAQAPAQLRIEYELRDRR
jgi:hypothetical protein